MCSVRSSDRDRGSAGQPPKDGGEKTIQEYKGGARSPMKRTIKKTTIVAGRATQQSCAPFFVVFKIIVLMGLLVQTEWNRVAVPVSALGLE